MIVENIGYISIDNLINYTHFSIFETHKNTHIIVLNTSENSLVLHHPKKDRLPWKLVEGKKICSCKKVFDSKIDNLNNINKSMLNNGNQIIVYQQYEIYS